MANAIPISMEILICFLVSTVLLNRYSDMVKTNTITIVGVFISWFFSFMVIFLLPADLTSTSYRQCIFDYQSRASSTTPSPSLIITSPIQTKLNDSLLTSLTNSSSPTSTALPSNTSTASVTNPVVNISNSSNLINPCVVPWNYVTDQALIKLWRFIYWSSQFLTWLVLPIMQSYSMAGDFTTSDRLKSAIRVNFIYYSSIGAIFLVLLTYVVFRDGLDFANLKVIAISSSNTWGLFLLVILLGYGLVELPRSIINRSKFSQSLDQLYFQVAKVNAEKIEVEEKLDDVLEEIQQALSSVGSNESSFLGQYLTKIMDRCPPDWKRRTNALRRQAAASNSINDSDRANLAYDIESLSRLHRKVKKVVNQHRQIICRWNQLIPEVVDWEDVAKNQMENLRVSVSPVFVSSLPREKSIFSHIYTPTVEWYWKCLVRVWLLRIVGTTLAALSIAVVWSEMTFPISIFSTKLSIFAYCVDQFQLSQRYFISELFSIFSMGYLAICAFYTVFHMKIFNVYHLAPRKQTEEYSLLFSGMLVCRLSAPLCLNYLCLVHRDSHVIKSNQLLETSFTTIMGHLDLIPILNNGLNIILPLCISAICLAIYFNIGTAILHKIGYEQYIKDDEMTLDWVQTGRDLVKREKAKMLRGYESSGATQQALSIVSGAATNVPKSSKGRAEITPSDKSITAAAGTGTPTSQTSSSSGLSRSSLLPKTNRSDPTVAFNDVNVTSASHISSPQRPDRSDDNIIEIDLGVQKRPPDKSRGFFDDI